MIGRGSERKKKKKVQWAPGLGASKPCGRKATSPAVRIYFYETEKKGSEGGWCLAIIGMLVEACSLVVLRLVRIFSVRVDVGFIFGERWGRGSLGTPVREKAPVFFRKSVSA